MSTYNSKGHTHDRFGKLECVSSIMNIERITNIDREKMGSFGILLVIDDVIYVCICTVYLYVFKEYTQHALVYDSHFSTL